MTTLTRKVRYPAKRIEWREVESSNIAALAWDEAGMFVRFKSGDVYLYHDVSRQRAVACMRAASVGSYLHKNIKPRYSCTKVSE